MQSSRLSLLMVDVHLIGLPDCVLRRQYMIFHAVCVANASRVDGIRVPCSSGRSLLILTVGMELIVRTLSWRPFSTVPCSGLAGDEEEDGAKGG